MITRDISIPSKLLQTIVMQCEENKQYIDGTEVANGHRSK